MRIRRIAGVLAAGVACVGMVAVAPPSQAKSDADPLVFAMAQTGPNPVVMGTGQSAEFTMTVTNPATNPNVPAFIVGHADDRSMLGDVTVAGGEGSCFTSGNDFWCSAGKPPTAPMPMTVQDWGLAPGGSMVVVAKVAPAAYLTDATLSFCSAANMTLDTEPYPCGSMPPGLPTPLEEQWQVLNATFDVVSQADLVLTATQPPAVAAGKDAAVTFTLKDAGPSPANNYRIAFTLPAGMSLVSGGPAPWKCTQEGQQVTCVWDVLMQRSQRVSQALAALDVTVKAPSPATQAQYDFVAQASSSVTDPSPSDAKATVTVPVVPVDLAVAKSVGTPVLVGDEATWTVTVSNVGTVEDHGKITITDTLPAAATFKAATAANWTCVASGQIVTCERAAGAMAAGASEKIVIVSRMKNRGPATNKVSVATTSYEKELANNTAQRTVIVKRAEQTAPALPDSPRRILSAKTEQGQKLTTRVRCTPVKATASGDASYCRIKRSGNVVRVSVQGSAPMRVKVTQAAKGTTKYKPFLQRKVYRVRP